MRPPDVVALTLALDDDPGLGLTQSANIRCAEAHAPGSPVNGGGLGESPTQQYRETATFGGGTNRLFADHIGVRVPCRLRERLTTLIGDEIGPRGRVVGNRILGKFKERVFRLQPVLREEVMKELREIQSKSAELTERRVAAEDQLKRVEIRAPSAGFVHQFAVHTIGGVITPAEPAMLIVPAEDALQLEARVNPPDIDQIALGRLVQIKLHAFNQRTTPELAGQVSRISADTSRDQQTGATFYTIRVTILVEEYARLEPHRVSAGMQAEAFVQTEDHTPLQYIVKPLKDQITRAFRER